MKFTGKILALDAATKTGWFHSSGQSGVVALKGEISERLETLEGWLTRTVETLGADLIALEHSAFGSRFRATREFHGRLRGVIELVARRLGVELKMVNITTAKSIATGNGRAKKDQMMRSFNLFVGRDPRDDNEADAWAVFVAAQQGAFMQEKFKARKPKGTTVKKVDPMLFDKWRRVGK